MSAQAASQETAVQARSKPALLPRSMGLVSTLGFAVIGISLFSSAVQPFATVTGIFPGVSLAAILSAGAGVCMVLAFAYALIGAAVKKNAPDYVLATRVIHPLAGFISSWALVAFSGLVVGTLMAQVGQVVIPVFMRTIAIIGNAQAMMISADFFTTPQGISVAGSIATIAAFLLAILPFKFNRQVMAGGLVLILLGWIVLIVQLLFPASPFSTAWDHFMGVGSFAMQLPAAADAGMKLVSGAQPALIAGMLFAFLLFFGFQSPTFMAGEVKQPERSLLVGNLVSVVVAWALIAGAALLLQRQVPAEWISSQSYLFLAGKQAYPWLNFYAAVLLPNPPLVILISFSWLFSLINVAQVFFIFTSRILLAWAEDGILPEALGFVHPQLHTPVPAILISAILAQVVVLFVASGSAWVSNNLVFILIAVLTQLFPALALIILPWVKRDWFASRAKIVRLKIGPLPLVSLVGLLVFAYDIWLVGYSLYSPQWRAAGQDALPALVVVAGSAVIYYILRRTFLKPSSKNLPESFREFPESD